jgi:hypothetical protein
MKYGLNGRDIQYQILIIKIREQNLSPEAAITKISDDPAMIQKLDTIDPPLTIHLC